MQRLSNARVDKLISLILKLQTEEGLKTVALDLENINFEEDSEEESEELEVSLELERSGEAETKYLSSRFK